MQNVSNSLFRKNLRILSLLFLILSANILMRCSNDQVSFVKVVSDTTGHILTVDDTPFFVNGMNWDYYPIGTNYKFILWDQPDDFIRKALEREMTALKAIGVNAIRLYTGVPPRWVEYIYETYDIYTILNHPFGRYGAEVEGQWVANVDYGDPATREVILQGVIDMVEDFRYVPGVLMWLLGNENNYGLIWESAQTHDMPEERLQDIQPARDLYSLMNEAVRLLHIRDNRRPVAIANGDTQFLDLIAEEIEDLDIFGTNVYRGTSFGDLFHEVKEKLDLPVLITEFGADAYHSVEMREDEDSQVHYILENWYELQINTAGRTGSGNAIGGCTFQFTDGWWKSGPDDKLDIHDTQASWSNGGYGHDFIHGETNMNEEWFGICAKGPTTADGLYELQPRKAYHLLKQIHSLDPFSPDVTNAELEKHFSSIRNVRTQTMAPSDSTFDDASTQ